MKRPSLFDRLPGRDDLGIDPQYRRLRDASSITFGGALISAPFWLLLFRVAIHAILARHTGGH